MEMGNDSMLNDLFLFLAIPQICLLLKAKQSDSKIKNQNQERQIIEDRM